MMRATGQHVRSAAFALFLGAVLMGGARFWAAETTNASNVTNLGSSPVQEFRRLLTMDSKRRAEELELHPPGMREPIEAKVNEYLALPAGEREARLQATELRHYMNLLLPVSATNRAPLIRQIPEPMRELVESRLERWDIMPPPMRDEVVENERVVSYFAQLSTMTSVQRKALLDTMEPAQREKLDADIKRWRKLSPSARKQSFAQFNELFTLTAEERNKTLSYLSESERESMQVTLDAFAELTPEQRKTCIQSFQKFASMGLAERQEFLKKAEAWQRMTPAEREQWREVVRLVPELPPLPPGFPAAVATTVAPTPAKTNLRSAEKTNGG